MADLDPLDRALLAALRTDARTPAAELARTLQVTRATVAKRIERLQREGVILGFTVRVAEDADPTAIRAVSHLAIEGRNVDAAIRSLRGLPEITRLHATAGEWDLVAELLVPTLADVDRTLSRIREIPGVYRSETSLLLRSVLM